MRSQLTKKQKNQKYNVWVCEGKKDKLARKSVSYTTAQKWLREYDKQGIGAYMIRNSI